MQLSVSSRKDGDAVVVDVGGEVDVYTAPALRRAVDKQIAEGHIHLVVVLDRVDFIDSTGLGVLVGRLKMVRHHSGWLKIVCTNDRVMKIFGITGLDKVFNVYETVDAAVAG